MDMGNLPSGHIHECMEVVDFPERSEGTPVSVRVLPFCLDPRSPTAGIPRTPIEVAVRTKEEIETLPPSGTVLLQNEKPGPATVLHSKYKPENYVLISDPRSPTSEISRTPIQVSEPSKQIIASKLNDIKPTKPAESKYFETDAEVGDVDDSPYAIGLKAGATNKDKVFDRNLPVLKERKALVDENFYELEKENEGCLKRKLFLTPESSPVIQAGLKMRNPLGSMSNYQQSPSLLLKMKQAKKLEQSARAIIYDLEGTPNKHTPRNEKQSKRQQIAEWDKDDTVLI